MQTAGVAVVAVVACLSCAAEESADVQGLAESGASDTAEPSAASDPAGNQTTDASTGDSGLAQASTPTSAATGSEQAGGGVETVASGIALTSANNEFNTQPDDEDWGLLAISGGHTTTQSGEHIASATTKLVVIDIEVTYGRIGNLFDEAFRLQADGKWYSPLNQISNTGGLGQIYNGEVVFEIPRSPTTVTLEGGLPEALGVGRRATYDLTFTPGSPPEPTPVGDDQVAAVASDISPASGGNEFNTQPDDEDWGLLAVTNAHTSLIEGEHAATPATKLVVIEIEVTYGRIGNLFDEAFRLQADGKWYSPLNHINNTGGVGDIYYSELVFEIPRQPTTVTLEAGFPSALSHYEWPFSLRTITYDITFG